MNPAPKKYYSVKEASRLLGVSTNTLYKYLEEGKIRSRRIGRGRFKIPQKELLPYLETGQNEKQTGLKQAQPGLAPSLKQTDSNNNEGTVENTPIAWNDLSDSVAFEKNDVLVFRMFKSLVYLGLALIYIFASPANYALGITNNSSLGTFLVPFLPYALFIVGILNLFEALFKKQIVSHFVIDLVASLVSAFYAFVSLVSGDYGLFVFAISLCGVSLSHLLTDVKENVARHNFLYSFAKFSLLLSAMGGIIVTLLPEVFPIYSVVSFIRSNRELFAFFWFLFLFVPAAYIASPKGIRSAVRMPYFTLGSFLALIIAVKSMLIPNWDIAYICFLTGIFGVFLAWWIESKVVFDIKRLGYLFLTFSWASLVILVSFYTLDVYSRQSDRKVADGLQASLDEISTRINTVVDQRGAILVSYAGKPEVVEAIKSKDEEATTLQAKGIYDQVGNLARVIFYNNDGIAVGVYPRSSLTQGTNFSSRDYFQKTLQGKKGYISDTFTSILDTPTVVQTEPVFEGNEVIGMLGVATNPENFVEAFQLKNGDFNVSAFDSKGNIIFQTNQANDNKEINVYTLTDSKSNEFTLTRQISYPSWKVSITNLGDVTPANLSSLASGLIAIIVLNSIFSVFIGVLVSKRKSDTGTFTSPNPIKGPEFISAS